MDKAFSFYNELHIEFRFEWGKKTISIAQTIWMMKNVKPSQVVVGPLHSSIMARGI